MSVKSRFVTIAVIGILFALMSGTAYALSVTVGDVTAAPGATEVSVPIRVDDVSGVAAASFTLTFDPFALAVVTVRPSELTQDFQLVVNANLFGELRFNLSRAAAVPSGNGAIATVVFGVRPDAQLGQYKLELTRADFLNQQVDPIQVGNNTPGTFRVAAEDRIAPSVVASSPAKGMTGVDPGAVNRDGIVITFNEPVNTEKIQVGLRAGGRVLLWNPAWSEGNTVLTLKPPSGKELGFETRYQVVLSQVADLAGNAAPQMEIAFTTRAGGTPSDTRAPFITSSAPASGAAGVDPGGVNRNGIVVTFSEAVNKEALGAVIVGKQEFRWQTQWLEGDTKLVLKPDQGQELGFGQEYALMLSNVTDAAGNAVPEIQIRFTTLTPVRPPPVAVFAASPGVGAGSLGVAFTDRSENEPFAWTWDFGDGAGSDEQNPRHTYADPGTYDVMLTVENLTGTHSVSMPVTVTAPEEALELLGQYPLAGAEYFIDRDPGYGAGTAISILPGMNAEMKVGIATGDLSLGTHTLYVRVKDEKGYWGIPEARSFTVAPLSSVALQAAEYFIDQDPGYGAGTAIPIDPAVSTTRTFTAPIQNLESGFHSLYVRVQDQDGNWGIPEPRPFYIVPQASLSPLAELEYFFNDADPGVGKAQKIKTSGSGVVDLTALLPTEGLAIGSHTVTIRAKNTAGIWGLGNQVPFVINEKGPNAAPVAVRKIERQELKPGGAPYALPVAGETPLFTDSNGDALSYEVSSSKESVATVSLSDGVLRVTPVGEGGTTVTVKAADGASGTATLTFQVVVRGDPNNPPVLSRAISEQVLSLGGESFTRDLRGDSPAFTDADQDAVTFVVESSDEKVVVASVSEGVLKVSPVVEGTATVTVRADDGKGGTASMTFRVSVVREAVTAQIGVDLQVGSNGDGVLKQENAIEAPPGQPVTVEIFASGYDGTLGMQAVFFLDHPEAVLSAKANKSEALPILLGDGVSLDGNRLEVFLGSLEEVREEGDGLKLVGSVTLTLADGFEGLTLTLETVVFEANVSRAAPGLMLTVKPILDVPNPDINEDGVVDFKDFILFARAFGGEDGDEKYQKRIDLDRDGEIGFRDFVLFAQWFGRDPLEFVPPANRIALAKAAGNSGGAVSLRLEAGSAGRSDEAVVVVEVAGEMDIEGYSFTVQYDERALVWIGAEALAPSRFVASGEPAIVQDGTGEVVLADMLGSPVVREAGGDLVLLRFQTKDENLSGAVEIAGALVSDRSGRLGELTGAMLEAVRPVPSEPALLRNFPNPFNPVTQIHYQLQGTEDVSLVVYNVLGQRVRVLVQERQVAGYYRLAWDGEDAVGRPVSSGIYLYRLTAGKFAATRRMLLLK